MRAPTRRIDQSYQGLELTFWFTLVLDVDCVIRDLKQEISKRIGVPENNVRVYNKGISYQRVFATGVMASGGPSGGGNLGGAARVENLDSGTPLSNEDILTNYNFNKVKVEFGGKDQPTRIFMI